MSDEAALLAAILANPDEDTSRLAYADWLDEHADAPGRARAEFIRLQIEAERGAPTERRAKAVAARCAELLRAHERDWLAPFRAAAGGATLSLNPTFGRGFVARVGASHHTTPAWFAPVAEVCPVQEIAYGQTFAEAADEFAAVARCPALARVRRLDCEALLGPLAEALLTSEYLTGLRQLTLNWRVGLERLEGSALSMSLRELWAANGEESLTPDRGVGALLGDGWPALEVVHLRGAGGSAGAARLAAAFTARGRMGLHISDHALTWPGAQRTIAAALTGRLDSLSLSPSRALRPTDESPLSTGNALRVERFFEDGDRIAAWLTSVLPPGRFERLGLYGCRMSQLGARTLAGWEGLAQLKELDLTNNWIGDVGAGHLAASPHLANVERLFVAHNDITQRGKDALKKRFGRRVRIS